MLGRYKPLWEKKAALKSNYDAVIIGGGLHGLAAQKIEAETGLPTMDVLLDGPDRLAEVVQGEMARLAP